MRWLILLTGLAGLDGPTPTLDALATEAARSKLDAPGRWAGFASQVDRAIADYNRRLVGYRNRAGPKPLDLKPLGLPLAFLVAEARRLGEAPDAVDRSPRGMMGSAPGVRLDPIRAFGFGPYLDAIAGHPDGRRIGALLEYRGVLERRWPGIDPSTGWPALIARAATRDWAVGQVRDLVRDPPAINRYVFPDSLGFRLIDRFASELPPDAATIAYDYLRAADPLGPRNGERVWDVLLRVDPARARREIIPYFDDTRGKVFPFNIYVVFHLNKHAGPSPELAEAARGWLARDGIDRAFGRDLKVILLRADPAREVGPTVKAIETEIADRAREAETIAPDDDASRLIPALGQVDTREADDALIRYLGHPTVPPMTQVFALEAIIRHGRPEAPALFARWLADKSPSLQSYVRVQAAEHWGEPGRRLLDRVGPPK